VPFAEPLGQVIGSRASRRVGYRHADTKSKPRQPDLGTLVRDITQVSARFRVISIPQTRDLVRRHYEPFGGLLGCCDYCNSNANRPGSVYSGLCVIPRSPTLWGCVRSA
jgi:hypothetical protein